MAMPKKGTRLITVDGTAYRWRVSHRPGHTGGDDLHPLTFAVERAEEPAGVLVVSLPCARADNRHGRRTIVVRPLLVAGCVRRAVEHGWNPAREGPAFTFAISEEDLTEVLGEPPRYLIPFLWGMIPEGGGVEDLPRAVQIRGRDGEPIGRIAHRAPGR
ncbi:hypothetical protein [Nonomuraea phyllanthi]|uniref:hypothetical protein n=1 Tax=Nonomuraea phyllanthi TaxID=2219224 RepID=UPI00186AF78F|nr:hypothetical protein [Nonomuraea phyllanthi]